MKFVVLVTALLLSACAMPMTATPDTRITLVRGACLFHCPYYQVVITGDGQVTYTGRSFVEVSGEQHSTISHEDVAHLLQLFDRVHFNTLKPEYRANITDQATFILRLRRSGREKEVRDYVGEEVGMPHDVTLIENEIDRVAGTARWVGHVE